MSNQTITDIMVNNDKIELKFEYYDQKRGKYYPKIFSINCLSNEEASEIGRKLKLQYPDLGSANLEIDMHIKSEEFYYSHISKLNKMFKDNISIYKIDRYYYINGAKVSYNVDMFSSFFCKNHTNTDPLDVVVINNISNTDYLQVMSHTKNILYVQGEIRFNNVKNNEEIILDNKEYYIGILCNKNLLIANFKN